MTKKTEMSHKMRGTYDCFYQLLHQIQRQKQSSKLSLATSSALPKQKKTRSPREICWTKAPNEHCERRRVCACTRRSKHAETTCIVKSTGMTNREIQTGVLSHFKNRSGFALRRNAWHTKTKNKKRHCSYDQKKHLKCRTRYAALTIFVVSSMKSSATWNRWSSVATSSAVPKHKTTQNLSGNQCKRNSNEESSMGARGRVCARKTTKRKERMGGKRKTLNFQNTFIEKRERTKRKYIFYSSTK